MYLASEGIKEDQRTEFVGFVGSVEEAMTVIRQYELETTTKFSCFKSDKMFGAGGKIIMKQ